jgi:hypothetical protein
MGQLDSAAVQPHRGRRPLERRAGGLRHRRRRHHRLAHVRGFGGASGGWHAQLGHVLSVRRLEIQQT